MKQENAILPKIDLESLRAFLHAPLHFKNLPEAIKSLKATTNNSRKIDPSNWLTLLIIDWGHS